MNWERLLVVDDVLGPGVFGQSGLAFFLEFRVLLRVGFRVELVEHVDEKVEAAGGVHRRLEVLEVLASCARRRWRSARQPSP